MNSFLFVVLASTILWCNLKLVNAGVKAFITACPALPPQCQCNKVMNSGVAITCHMDNTFPLCLLVDLLYNYDKEITESCPKRCKHKRNFVIDSLNVVYCKDSDYFRKIHLYHPQSSYAYYIFSDMEEDLEDDIDEFPKLNIKNLAIYGCRKEININSTAFAALSGTLERLTLAKLAMKYIPESVGNLTRLLHLELPENNISRVTGSQLKKLKNLEYLSLRKNKLNDVDGAFELSKKNRLSTLDLSYNKLTSFPSVKALQNLTTLKLGNNNLKEISSVMGLLKLKYIDLENNNLSLLPQYMFTANPSLYTIDLSSNQLKSIENNVFVSLPNLTHLYLTDNSLSSIGSLLKETPNLKTLNLNHNKFVDLKTSLFANHKAETIDINLEHNNITNLSSELFEGTLVNDLKLGYNQIQHANNISLYNTTNIQCIHLTGNNFVKECLKPHYYIPLLAKLTNGTESVVGSFSGYCYQSMNYYVSAAERSTKLPPLEQQPGTSTPATPSITQTSTYEKEKAVKS